MIFILVIFFVYIFYSHGKKRLKKIASGKIDINEADLFDTFRVSTTIHGRFYSDTHSILGRTYGVCVLQVSSVYIYYNLLTKSFKVLNFYYAIFLK